MVDGASCLCVRLGKSPFSNRDGRSSMLELNLGSLSHLGEAWSLLKHKVPTTGRAQADLPHEHTSIHKAASGAAAADAQPRAWGTCPYILQALPWPRAGLCGALRLDLLGQGRSDLNVRWRAMLKAPLLRAKLKTWRGWVGQRQRGQSDLLVSSHNRANILKRDVHILSSHRTPAH